MDRFIQRPKTEQRELIHQTAAKLDMESAAVEKDFWVCWILKRLFLSPLRHSIIFKGGTSLSKAYGLIKRFSEDIDIILNWDAFCEEGHWNPGKWISLLYQVSSFKYCFYRAGWADYLNATPGTMHLVPNENILEDLKADYSSMMREMLPANAPSLASLLDEVALLEQEINQLPPLTLNIKNYPTMEP